MTARRHGRAEPVSGMLGRADSGMVGRRSRVTLSAPRVNRVAADDPRVPYGGSDGSLNLQPPLTSRRSVLARPRRPDAPRISPAKRAARTILWVVVVLLAVTVVLLAAFSIWLSTLPDDYF